MKKKPKYDFVLFIVLMVLGLMPLLQGWLRLIPIKPLTGVVEEIEKPTFSFDAYCSGSYAKGVEDYASRHFGFRELAIRFYNQYLWSCYHKTYAKDVVAGKKGWLYYPQSVSDYYGKELLRWNASADEAKNRFDRDVKYLNWARQILKENSVDLMVFMSPEKGFLYPEYLPDDERDTTTFNAYEYFAECFDSVGFPYIEMTRWFQQIKDTVSYPLIPQTGAHWVFPSVYAADSLFRFMGDLKGVNLPEIVIGPMYESKKHGMDNDLEQLLNLSLPIRHRYGFAPRAEVSIAADSTMVKPKVLFVGNSYMWSMVHFVPFNEVFDDVEFWYYFSTAYYGEDLSQTKSVTQFDFLEKILDFDYVVWFTTGNQMNKGTMGFAEKAIMNLCYGPKEIYPVYNRIMDSLRYDSLTLLTFDQPLCDSNYKQKLWPLAEQIVNNHPERYFLALDSDSLPTVRNSRIKEIVAINEIKKDSVWMRNLSAFQTIIQNAPFDQVLLMEAYNIIEGKPLMRDMDDPEAKRNRVNELVKAMEDEIRLKPAMMSQIEEKAITKGRSLEEQLNYEARWIVNDKINRGVLMLE